MPSHLGQVRRAVGAPSVATTGTDLEGSGSPKCCHNRVTVTLAMKCPLTSMKCPRTFASCSGKEETRATRQVFPRHGVRHRPGTVRRNLSRLDCCRCHSRLDCRLVPLSPRLLSVPLSPRLPGMGQAGWASTKASTKASLTPHSRPVDQVVKLARPARRGCPPRGGAGRSMTKSGVHWQLRIGLVPGVRPRDVARGLSGNPSQLNWGESRDRELELES